MNWKSTAVVWGAGLLATWYAATPPVPSPTTVGAPRTAQPGNESPTAAESDIAREAARLQEHLHLQEHYVSPRRNPFRFSRATDDVSLSSAPTAPQLPIPLAPPPLAVTLAGIAGEQVPDGMDRTAILSTDAGVVLARVGDEVLGQYRVVAIRDESVDLVDVTTGLTLQLAFTP